MANLKPVRKIKDKKTITYWYIVDHEEKDGQRKQVVLKKLGKITEREAERAFYEWEKSSKSIIKPDLNFNCVLEKFKEYYKLQIGVSISEGTFINFLNYSRHFSFFEKYLIHEIKFRDIEAFKQELKIKQTKYKKPFENRSVNIALSELSKIFNYALEFEYIDTIPIIKRLSEAKFKQIISKTELEMAKILEECQTSEPELKFFLEFILFTGLRPNEVYNLKVSDINFLNKTILIRSHNRLKHGRLVPMSTRAIEILKQKQYLDDYITAFRNRFAVRTAIKRLKKKIPGLKLYPYMMRKTFASLMAENGFDPRFLSDIMGNKKEDTTRQYYINIRMEKLREELESKTNQLDIKKTG